MGNKMTEKKDEEEIKNQEDEKIKLISFGFINIILI
jgi:hypothetical protein